MALRGGLDLDGRIVIKVQLGNDVRKMLIHNDDVTYDELVLMMQRIYKGTIKQEDELTIKYKDEDGDLITIFDSSDVTFAIQTCNRQLKLVLYVNGLERSFDDAEVATIRKGLRDVRDLANSLLDQMNAKSSGINRLEAAKETEDEDLADDRVSAVNPLAASQAAIDNKEFDPLDSGLVRADSTAAGDNASSLAQYGSSQSGDQTAKSFDQLSMSDRQSVNQSPTPSNLQSSFGGAFSVNANQQPPATSTQQTSMSSYNQTPQPQSTAQPMSTSQAMSTAGYYNTTATSTPQYATSQAAIPAPGAQQQQYNYGQQQQQWGQHQQPSAQAPQQPPQQQLPTAPGQQQQYAGYGMPQQQQQPPQAQPPQQGMYGQPQQPAPASPYQSAPPGANPYSKPCQIRGSYPRASGAYPVLPTAGQPRPTYPPGQQ